jgi:hypothetical protein
LLAFLLLARLTHNDGSGFSFVIHVVTWIAIVVLFTCRKYWVCVGMTFAVFVNLCLWIVPPVVFWILTNSSASLDEVRQAIINGNVPLQFKDILWYAGLPLPIALPIIALFS